MARRQRCREDGRRERRSGDGQELAPRDRRAAGAGVTPWPNRAGGALSGHELPRASSLPSLPAKINGRRSCDSVPVELGASRREVLAAGLGLLATAGCGRPARPMRDGNRVVVTFWYAFGDLV